jgi:aurora kinase
MEVANLEAAFERITVNDENNEQIASSITSYHKAKVYQAPLYITTGTLTLQRLRYRLLHHHQLACHPQPRTPTA